MVVPTVDHQDRFPACCFVLRLILIWHLSLYFIGLLASVPKLLGLRQHPLHQHSHLPFRHLRTRGMAFSGHRSFSTGLVSCRTPLAPAHRSGRPSLRLIRARF